MTMLLTLENGEELVWTPSFRAHDNPSAQYLLNRGFELTWRLKLPGTRKALAYGPGRAAQPVTRTFCPACVVKHRVSHTSPHPLYIVCMAERFVLWLGREEDGKPKTFLDFRGTTLLNDLGPSWKHLAIQAFGWNTWRLMASEPLVLDAEGRDPRWLQPAHEYAGTAEGYVPNWARLNPGQRMMIPTGLKPTGRGGRLPADPFTDWKAYQTEAQRLATVALAVMNNLEVTW